MNTTMRITVNGIPEDVPPSATLADLIDLLHEIDRDLIVEHNGRFVFPQDYALHGWLPTIAWNSFTRILEDSYNKD
jgi:sulfur carrier protein ThiS